MRGRPFECGNKMGRGRPRGSRNQKTLFREVMEAHGEALIKKCQVVALQGDTTALRLCLERLLPPCKPSNHRFRLPALQTVSDLAKALPAVMRAVARGQLSAQEGEALASMMDSQRQNIEGENFETRLRDLEQKRREEVQPAAL